MTMTRPSNFDHALQGAIVWLQGVAEAFPTRDGEFAFRALRAWLHSLRDRLTVQAAAHFGAQLPELLRGIFYEGWNPQDVPKRYDTQAFITRFAREAIISQADARKVSAAVTEGLLKHLNANVLDKALEQLPAEQRAVLRPMKPAAEGSS